MTPDKPSFETQKGIPCVERVGGKAHNLFRLEELSEKRSFKVPPFNVIEVGAELEEEALIQIFESLEKPLVVRSSSPYEDSEGLSFAGVFESLLNINTLEELKQAIDQVRASAKSAQALEYAQEHGITIDDRMAVIVQEMIKPFYSGVCYSTANLDDPKTIIEYVYGLSHSLMSGNQQGNIASFYANSGLTLEYGEGIPYGAGQDLNLVKVAKVTKDLESVFGYRLDVEFAVTHDNRVYILQARSITNSEFPQIEIPEIDPLTIVLETDIVIGAGKFRGHVFLWRSYFLLQQLAIMNNVNAADYFTDQSARLKEFNNRYPEGYIVVADNLTDHRVFLEQGSHLRAIVTTSYASRYSHPAKVVSETQTFYLGTPSSDLMNVVQEGDVLTVVSDGQRGVMYDLEKKTEDTVKKRIDLQNTERLDYATAISMTFPEWETVDEKVIFAPSGIGVNFWDYNEENGIPTHVFYYIVDANGTIISEGEYRAKEAAEPFPDFPSFLRWLFLKY